MSGDVAAAVHGHRRSSGSALGLTACRWLANARGATLEHLGNCRCLGEKHPACLEKQLHLGSVFLNASLFLDQRKNDFGGA